tara:strand:- start:328 stop:558 length:231 start_codon:yes stop_codon:yes gene_type:complete
MKKKSDIEVICRELSGQIGPDALEQRVRKIIKRGDMRGKFAHVSGNKNRLKSCKRNQDVYTRLEIIAQTTRHYIPA